MILKFVSFFPSIHQVGSGQEEGNRNQGPRDAGKEWQLTLDLQQMIAVADSAQFRDVGISLESLLRSVFDPSDSDATRFIDVSDTVISTLTPLFYLICPIAS